MLTPGDIAHELGISPKTLRGKLRIHVTGHNRYERWLFSRAEADDIIRRYPTW